MNMRHGENCDILTQVAIIQEILEAHIYLGKILSRSNEIGLPNWYIGAGCIPTIVWNAFSGYSETSYLNDIDLVYFDASDLSQEREEKCQCCITSLFYDIPVKLDVKNQARVHLWYDKKFGRSIPPYASVESGINTWLSVTAIGVKKSNGQFLVYALYGLNDLLSMTVRPNRLLYSKEKYLQKTTRWKQQWPELTILPWDENIE